MIQAPIRSILVVGGGSAGWMAAAALSNALTQGVRIELVESDEIGTVGVGEATIPPIKLFNQQLGLDEAEFVRATKGSFKLGIEFVNWGREGHRYFHPFGTFGADFDAVPLHHHWLKARGEGQAPALDDLSMAWGAASRDRFAPPTKERRMIQSTYDYAYHFDAGLYAAHLRRYAEARGVTRHEGKIVDVAMDPASGHIASVTLDDGRTLAADLFIDCSGFRAILIEGTLKAGFEDWSRWLPCDRALAVPTARPAGGFTPYTRSTAHRAGWQWRIPLQHRTGNGHVYCSAFVSDDEAAETLLAHLDADPLADPRLLRFKAGRRKSAWIGNCVALGLAAGFLEPLESTSIHLVQSSIMRLLVLFPTREFDAHVIDEFNRVTREEWEAVRDFIILHYSANDPAKSDFWAQCASTPVPDGLQYKLDHFRSFGRLVSRNPELFQNASWLAVLIGQFVDPLAYDPIVDARPGADAITRLEGIARVIREAAEAMPRHAEFIARHCQADTPA